MAPVCSPTAIICVTIPGNTSLSFNGSVRDLPSSRDFLTCCKALSTTALPAVLAVMSSPSRMGTPLDINVPRVLVNRATAIFLINMPSTGSFRTMVSSTRRPCGVPYQTFRPKSLRRTAHRGRERRASFDLRARPRQDLLKELILLLAGQNFETLDEWQTGVDHDRELTRENRQLFSIDASAKGRNVEFLPLLSHFCRGNLLTL